MVFTALQIALTFGFKALTRVGGFFTGGSLESILATIDKGMDSDVEKEKVKAEITKKWIDRQAELLVGRTWWFQLFFVVPLGIWWSSVILDSIMLSFPWWTHRTAALPDDLQVWATSIISALFLVDGAKAVIGRYKK